MPLSAPNKNVTIYTAERAFYWVKRSIRPAPTANGQLDTTRSCVSMYRSPPITFKVPPGYTIPGATNEGQYVRQAGNQMPVGLINKAQLRTSLVFRRQFESAMWFAAEDWDDWQPVVQIYVLRTYNQSLGTTKVDIYYPGKVPGDSRKYPIQVYWGNQLILPDHRTGAKWIYSGSWSAQMGQKGNKFFIRTEDIVALKLMMGEPEYPALFKWCSENWGYDTEADIHAPLFNQANGKRTDFIYQSGSPVYRDCIINHDGYNNGWPADRYRGGSTAGWGFSHRSKVCGWTGGYTWILAQDPLGLQSQAIQTLNKVGNPNHVFYDAWPLGATGTKPTMTPVGVANWMKDNYYRPGVGASMWNVPLIGGDQRISSLRTNQFLVLTTLLGYKYRIAGWAAYADELANILTQVCVGGVGQPAYGCKTAEYGNIIRPDFNGSQLYVWDQLDGSGMTSTGAVGDGVGISGLGLKDFGWLRQTINHYFNLPIDDEDFTLTTMETTATYAQALRVYIWHKWRVLIGQAQSIPGYS